MLRLKPSLRSVYGRHHDFINRYRISDYGCVPFVFARRTSILCLCVITEYDLLHDFWLFSISDHLNSSSFLLGFGTQFSVFCLLFCGFISCKLRCSLLCSIWFHVIVIFLFFLEAIYLPLLLFCFIYIHIYHIYFLLSMYPSI